jgi:hypothetical protein
MIVGNGTIALVTWTFKSRTRTGAEDHQRPSWRIGSPETGFGAPKGTSGESGAALLRVGRNTYAYEIGGSRIMQLRWGDTSQKLTQAGAAAWTEPDSEILEVIGRWAGCCRSSMLCRARVAPTLPFM